VRGGIEGGCEEGGKGGGLNGLYMCSQQEKLEMNKCTRQSDDKHLSCFNRKIYFGV